MNQRIDELRTILREDPGSRLFFQLGDLLRKAGELHESEEILTSGLTHHARYVAAWMSLGRTQLDLAKFSEAERSFARALELDPENSVAARMIGETAERVGEWVRAIKAYKLARALSPRDTDLEERIEEITGRLSGGPDDISLNPGQQSTSGDSSIEAQSQPSSTQVTPPEPMIAEDLPAEFEEPFVQAPDPVRSRTVISVSEADPFAVASKGDTGVWLLADDVFALPDLTDHPAADDIFGVDPTEEIPSYASDEPSDFVEEQPLETTMENQPETVASVPEEVSASADIEPDFESAPVSVPEPEPEPEPESEPAQDFSMPTVTLARLALEQGDLPMAAETLQAILDRDPGHPEAAALQAQIADELNSEMSGISPADDAVAPTDPVATKAAALKGWMQNIRAAAERRAP